MEKQQSVENVIQIDHTKFYNFVGIYQCLSDHYSEEEIIDILETIEKSLENKNLNLRMGRKVKPYIFINGKTTVKWNWRLDKHGLSNVNNTYQYLRAGVSDLYPQLKIPHSVYDIQLTGMFDFFHPPLFSDHIYKLNNTKYSYARTEANNKIISLYERIKTFFIDDNELVHQVDTHKKLPIGARPFEGEVTSKFFYYFIEKEFLRVSERLYPNRLNNFQTPEADKVFNQGVEVSSNENNNNRSDQGFLDDTRRDTARILFDGEGYISLLGLYKICKKKEDADFIYNLIMTNQHKQNGIDVFVFLDGYELILKKKNIFKLGISIDDDYSLISRLASKINKEIDEPKVALKFTGFYIYRNYQGIRPYLVPCEESYINMTKVSYEYQRNIQFHLLEEYLEPSGFDGKVLPQSTQFYSCDDLHSGSINENSLYIFGGDLVKIIKKYFSPEDQLNFYKIKADRVYESAREVQAPINNKTVNEVDTTTLNFGSSSYNSPVIGYNISLNTNYNVTPKNDVKETGDADKSATAESSFVSIARAEHFRDTVESFFEFILSLNQDDLSSKSDIYQFFQKKYKKLFWCKEVKILMNSSQINVPLAENNIYYFIAALVELVRDQNIRRYKTKVQIYAGYELYRKNGALAASTISIIIAKATKHLEQYLK